MRIKSKASDFIVDEILEEGYLRERGPHRVYRVTKVKLTTLEAARALADEAGVASGDIGMAGLKDRQGVTTQFMSVHHGRPVFVKTPELRIDTAGFSDEALESRHSRGNAFDLIVRGLVPGDRQSIEEQAIDLRAHGMPNYFGEQRFGNVKHGQGWIARELALGRHEKALRMLLAGWSDGDDERTQRFKNALNKRWGDWRGCREIAGRFGQHISIFEHLAREEGDFAGAFRFVATRLRLIHLYAWQSHVWNRALARLVDHAVPRERRFAVTSAEGPLVFHSRGPLEVDEGMRGMLRLPGPGLDDVEHPLQRDLLALALRDEGLQPHQFRIEGVPGFQLKGEDRAILVGPRRLDIDAVPRASDALRLRFDLPRGAYATLVLARLVPRGIHAPRVGGDRDEARSRPWSDVEARDGGGYRDEDQRSDDERFDSGPQRLGDRGRDAFEPASDARGQGPRGRGGRGGEVRDSGERSRGARDDAPRGRDAGPGDRDERAPAREYVPRLYDERKPRGRKARELAAGGGAEERDRESRADAGGDTRPSRGGSDDRGPRQSGGARGRARGFGGASRDDGGSRFGGTSRGGMTRHGQAPRDGGTSGSRGGGERGARAFGDRADAPRAFGDREQGPRGFVERDSERRPRGARGDFDRAPRERSERDGGARPTGERGFAPRGRSERAPQAFDRGSRGGPREERGSRAPFGAQRDEAPRSYGPQDRRTRGKTRGESGPEGAPSRGNAGGKRAPPRAGGDPRSESSKRKSPLKRADGSLAPKPKKPRWKREQEQRNVGRPRGKRKIRPGDVDRSKDAGGSAGGGGTPDEGPKT